MNIDTLKTSKIDTKSPDKILQEDHWFKITQKLYDEESGEVPDPLQMRAAAIVSALGLPTGQYSALGVDAGSKTIDGEKDRVVAKYLTNHPGVVMREDPLIVSNDFRDIYPDGLPTELKMALEPDTSAIMEIEYEHLKDIRYRFGNTKNPEEADSPINYFRLAGDVDLFLRGYAHSKSSHENHKGYLQKSNRHAKIICIEGAGSQPFGKSLNLVWSNKMWQPGHYDALMHEAVDAGFSGYFAEVDARDRSKIKMDYDVNDISSAVPLNHLSDSFFKKYFQFLESEHPVLARKIATPGKLRDVLIKQTTFFQQMSPTIYQRGKAFDVHPYLAKDNEVSTEPTFIEFGQPLFTDALAAIKLHLIAKLMADGHIRKGPIIDYEGYAHLSSKSFFLRYPGYAMEVVLRTVNELMAGRAEEKRLLLKLFRTGDIRKIYGVFDNPDWKEIVKEIVRLSFKEVEDDPSKPTSLGPNQRKLLDHPIDFLKLYNIDPAKIMPSSEEMEKVRQKLLKQKQLKPSKQP